MTVFMRNHADTVSPFDRREVDIPWKDLLADERAPFLATARAALEAIREPSYGMVEAGIASARKCTDDWKASAACLPGHAWQAMIDAALAE